MKLSYNHANTEAGNESFLLRYQAGDDGEGDTCILVDAGDDVDPSEHLRPADDLVAICLTHAHSDHYQSLGDCIRGETTVYASPPTAEILDDVMELAARQDDVSTIEDDETIQPINSWTELAAGVSVHPVPAGHVPGAVGYLFQFDDGNETRHVLATGDFTDRRAAGYPGIDSALEDIDVLFLSVAMRDDFQENISEGLGRALQRAHAGAKTLVTTSGLLGVQATYLLSELAAQFQKTVHIRPVGQIANLYDAMEYECQHVDSVPVFDDPADCLERGTITLAGPEAPTEGSSGRLLTRIRDDPVGCVIQLHGSGAPPIDGGQCTVHSYEAVNHPSAETLKTVHDEIDPIHTVIVHRHGGAAGEFNHFDSCVWAPTDEAEYELYADGWQTPPWMSAGSLNRETAPENSLGAQVGMDLVNALSLPDITRHDRIDLEAEGVDVDRVAAVLDQRSAYVGQETGQQGAEGDRPSRYRTDTDQDSEEGSTSLVSPNDTERASVATDGATEADIHEGDAMTGPESNEAAEESSDKSSTGSEPPKQAGLVETISGEFQEPDPQAEAAMAAGEIDRDDLRTIAKRVRDNEAVENTQTGDADSEGDPESSDGVRDEDYETEYRDSDHETETTTPDEVQTAEDKTESEDESRQAGKTESEGTADHDTDDAVRGTEERQSSTDNRADNEDTQGEKVATVEVELSALTIALAERATQVHDEGSVPDVVRSAVRVYLESILAGNTEPPDESPGNITLSGTGPIEDAVMSVAQRDTDIEDIESLVKDSLGEFLGGERRAVEVPGFQPYLSMLDAVITNETAAVSSRAELITTAIHFYVASDVGNGMTENN